MVLFCFRCGALRESQIHDPHRPRAGGFRGAKFAARISDQTSGTNRSRMGEDGGRRFGNRRVLLEKQRRFCPQEQKGRNAVGDGAPQGAYSP